MRVTMLYDSGDRESQAIAREAEAWIESAGYEMNVFDTKSISIASCTGCFGCWIKTPGICVQTGDAGNDFCKSIIQGDYILRITRITYGGYSSSIKIFNDRTIPILHPDFRRVNGEMHHKARYAKYPYQLTIGWGAESRDEKETFIKVYRANLINFFEKGADMPLILKGDEDGAVTEWLRSNLVSENNMTEAAV